MAEKTPNYFDIVDIVDKALPPKREIDYTAYTSEDLIERLEKAVEESGFYIPEATMLAARRIIEEDHRFNFGRISVFVGGGRGDFDQDNYTLQNSLSSMKCGLIRTLAKKQVERMDSNPAFFNTDILGDVESLKTRMTKENVKNYVRNVLVTTWEGQDTIRLEQSTLAYDILYHFGLKPSSSYSESKIAKDITDIISRLEFSTRDFHGPRDSEGYYNSSTTNKDRYGVAIDNAVEDIAVVLYAVLRDTLHKTEEFEAKHGKRSQEKNEPKREPKEPEPKSSLELEAKEPEEKKAEEPTPEVPIEDLEATMAKYEKLEKLIARNKKLAQELAELRKKAAEIEAEMKKNDEEIKSSLGNN